MSQRREQITEWLPSFRSALERLGDRYHVPVLAALVAFMFWIRVRNWEAFVTPERVLFSGNDAWYHYRTVGYTLRHWPQTIPFDPWTSFPTGTAVGQFGTLYDQIIATAALLMGLGSPTERTVALALLFAPAVFGVLTAIPVYLIGTRLGGRFGGVIAVVILALSPGDFLRRSLVGFSDHHVAEAFFQAFAVLAVLVAVEVARREKPVYELLAEREPEGLRRPLGWAALAGVAIALYIWVWPPGVFLVGILGAYFAVGLTAAYLAGESPEHVAIVGAVALSVAGVLTLVPLTTTSVSPTDFSVLQPALAFGVAAGCVFMAWLARAWDERGLSRLGYPAAIVGGVALLAGVVSIALPDVAALIRSQFLRVAGFGTSATARTVGEAQPIPLDQAGSYFYFFYGLTYLTAAVAALLMCWRIVRGTDDRRPEYLLVIVWTIFLTAATLTQVRFNYYLVVPVAALNAFFVGWLVRLVRSTESAERDADRNWLGGLETYHVVVIVAAILLITAPLVVRGQYPTASEYADSSADPGEVTGWEGSLEWLRTNTPKPGTYSGADNPMAYYGSYPQVDDFDYPPGAYGVMSWWDYGHFITSIGKRIPVANPFQQNAVTAANFLLATNESHAIEELPKDQGGQGVRYVMLDWKLADPSSRKFTAPIVFYNDGPLTEADVLTRLYDESGRREIATIRRQRYYESMRVRLYYFHGSAVSPQPLVIDYGSPQTVSQSGLGEVRVARPPQGQGQNGTVGIVRQFETLSAARQYVERDGSAQIGGIQGIPAEPVPALEHFRLVRASQESASSGTPWVKTFERVPGATVEGTGPPNATVTASVELRMPGANETFTYVQRARTDASGTFRMTLPYSTTGYERWGVAEGYTNVSVQATGPYRFSANTSNETAAPPWNATAGIPEGAVIGERNATIDVALEREAPSATNAANGASAESSTAAAAGPDSTAASGPLERAEPSENRDDRLRMGVPREAVSTGPR